MCARCMLAGSSYQNLDRDNGRVSLEVGDDATKQCPNRSSLVVPVHPLASSHSPPLLPSPTLVFVVHHIHHNMPFGPLGPSLAPWIRARPTIYRYIKPFADWYANLAGYRKLGLKYDDLRTCAVYAVSEATA